MALAYRAHIEPGGRTVADPLRPAHTHWTRLRGLIGTPELATGSGLWIRPCRQVHMFWMRYPIDVVFLDDAHRILDVTSELQPWTISPKVPDATSVIELRAGSAATLGLSRGSQLSITPA